MDGACLLERLTASDLFMLLWEDYGWSTDIGALAILDGTSLLDPDGQLRIEGAPDPVRRLERIAADTAARKHQPRPEAGTGIFRFIAAQRLWQGRAPG